MEVRTKGEQKAYLDGYEMCAKCIETYLSDEGKKILECLLSAVRNAVEIEDIISAEPCEGYISRQAIITEFKAQKDAWEYYGESFYNEKYIKFDDVVETISKFPSVQPTKKGEWIERRNKATGHIESVCSVCGAEESYPYNLFCPNCGADMKGGE